MAPVRFFPDSLPRTIPAGLAFAMLRRDWDIFALPRMTRHATHELSNDSHQAPTPASYNGVLM